MSRVRVIIAGETLNYGKNFTAEKDTKIAVIPVGYSDGYKTGMTNGGYVIIKNRKCYIKGMVCMDQITVEIPNDLEVNEEDEVMLITTEGIIIRMEVSGISEIGRNTSGVRLINMNLEKDISVASIAKVRDQMKTDDEELPVEETSSKEEVNEES